MRLSTLFHTKIWLKSVLVIKSVPGIGASAFFGYGIVIDHAVDHAGGDKEAKPWFSEELKCFGAVVFRKAEHGDAITGIFQNTTDDCMTKGRMIHVGFADYINKVRRVPAALLDFGRGYGKKIKCQKAHLLLEMCLL